ncbi:mechanosensitive ion channel family protein [soil metagenome]
MPHYPDHVLMALAALAATAFVWSLTVNRVVRRKLKLSLFLLGAYLAVHVVLLVRPELAGGGGDLSVPSEADLEYGLRPFERLALAGAVINLLVISLINPLRQDRVREGFPAIVQDAIVLGILALVGTFVFKEQLLTTSAIGAVVVGFALQDTLGNAIAGLAIQSERPFHVSHWIRVGEFEGRVAEITWRATKLRTRTGNFVVVPNNIIARDAIVNYSEPAVPTRLEVEVGVSYQAPPPSVKGALLAAMSQAACVMKSPPPDVLLIEFDDSSMRYQARFWVEDYEFEDEARDQVRTAIHYALARRGIEIPYPIAVEIGRDWVPPDPQIAQREREAIIERVHLFAALAAEQRAGLAAATRKSTYGDGEVIVRQGEVGDSLYVLSSGKASVPLEPDQVEVATITPGGYFGEMSLLTGEPRSATVIARGEVVVLELGAELFRRLGADSPHTIEGVALAAVGRRAELDVVRATARGTAVADAPATFFARTRKFLGLTP